MQYTCQGIIYQDPTVDAYFYFPENISESLQVQNNEGDGGVDTFLSEYPEDVAWIRVVVSKGVGLLQHEVLNGEIFTQKSAEFGITVHNST